MKKYRKAPYRQSQISLALSLAYLRRLFGDSIRFKSNESTLIDMAITSSDIIFDLIEGQYPDAYISYRQLLSEEKKFVNVIYRLFGFPDSAVGKDYTVIDAYTVLKTWWNNLPPMSRVASIYMKTYIPTLPILSTLWKKLRERMHIRFFLMIYRRCLEKIQVQS